MRAEQEQGSHITIGSKMITPKQLAIPDDNGNLPQWKPAMVNQLDDWIRSEGERIIITDMSALIKYEIHKN